MSKVCTSYALALYELAAEEGLENRILQELDMLEGVFAAVPAYLRLLSSPELSKEQRCKLAGEALQERVHPYTANTLMLMTEKGIARHFCDCCREYKKLYDDRHGILAVTAVTAVALTEAQISRLADKLQNATGKTVRIHNRVDPECMGGVRLDYAGKQLDGTVQNRLKSIHEHLKNTVL